MLDALHRDGINLDMCLVFDAQLHHRYQPPEGGNLCKHFHHDIVLAGSSHHHLPLVDEADIALVIFVAAQHLL